MRILLLFVAVLILTSVTQKGRLTPQLSNITFQGEINAHLSTLSSLIASTVKDGDTQQGIREAFMLYDLNKNGYVTAEDIKRVLINHWVNFIKDEIDERFKETDYDWYGKFNYQEFTNLMKTN